MKHIDETELYRNGSIHLDAGTVEDCVRACIGCAQAITDYADANLTDAQMTGSPQQLPQDIILADLCGQTARLMGQHTSALDAMRQQIEETLASIERYADKLADLDAPAHLRQTCIEACLDFTRSAEAFLAQLKQPA